MKQANYVYRKLELGSLINKKYDEVEIDQDIK